MISPCFGRALNHQMQYYISLMPFSAPGFTPSAIHGPLLEQKVEIVTMLAKGTTTQLSMDMNPPMYGSDGWKIVCFRFVFCNTRSLLAYNSISMLACMSWSHCKSIYPSIIYRRNTPAVTPTLLSVWGPSSRIFDTPSSFFLWILIQGIQTWHSTKRNEGYGYVTSYMACIDGRSGRS